jgi:hypothetical protein
VFGERLRSALHREEVKIHSYSLRLYHWLGAASKDLPGGGVGLLLPVRLGNVIAFAAEDGALSRQRLRAMSYQDGVEYLHKLPGIGPFSAELVMIRGVGHPDVLPDHDTRLTQAISAAYGAACLLSPVSQTRRLGHHRRSDSRRRVG